MSQATDWSVPLTGPATPNVMAQRMDDSFDALLSAHSGASRPAYAVAGTEWVSTATAGFLKYYVYDGTADRLIKTIDTSTGAVVYADGTVDDVFGKRARRGHLYGLTLSNNATDATNDIDIAVGEAASDDTDPFLLKLASALTKRLDAAWAVGSGNGGWLDGASMPNGTGHAFLIERSDTGVRDVGFSASTSPTLPANYDRKRRIGSIRRVSGAILAFTQTGDVFKYVTPPLDRNSTAAQASTLLAFSIPTGVVVRPIIAAVLGGGASTTCSVLFGDATAGSANLQVLFMNSPQNQIHVVDDFVSNTSGQIYFSQTNFVGTPAISSLNTLGWIDTRGRV